MNSFPTWPKYEKEDAQLAAKIISSGKVNYWTGEYGKKFERTFAQLIDVDYAVAVANGSLALDICLEVLGIGSGDEVIVTARSFIASAFCIKRVGADVVFADVDLQSQNITPETVAPHITIKTKAIICVHLAGWPCDMPRFQNLADKHNIYLVEDCAQAHGAKINGQSVGSFGHINAWSFCQDKIMTTAGEGGMITTNDPELYERAWSLKDHGKSREIMQQPFSNDGYRYVHASVGTNMRMTEIQSAIGLNQCRRLTEWTKIRRAHADILAQACIKSRVLDVFQPPENVEHAYYVFYALLKKDANIKRNELLQNLQGEGVPVKMGACPAMYHESAFENSELSDDNFLYAKILGEQSLMFQIHPALSTDDMQCMADLIVQTIQRMQGVANA